MIYMRNITITTAKSATYLENVGLDQRVSSTKHRMEPDHMRKSSGFTVPAKGAPPPVLTQAQPIALVQHCQVFARFRPVIVDYSAKVPKSIVFLAFF